VVVKQTCPQPSKDVDLIVTKTIVLPGPLINIV
jgi:hypothetical protein